MKILFYLIIFFIFIGCSPNKEVYWCGDHPCINKEEKKAYFKKTMIVEIKELKNKSLKDNSEIEKIIMQAQGEEKKRIKKEKNLTKLEKLEEKMRIKKEKNSIKQAKLEEKKRIKEEKKLAKQIERDEKKTIKGKKKLARKIEKKEQKIIKKGKKVSKGADNISPDLGYISSDSTDFKKLVEKITKRNNLKPYPDINDIPN